jgi:uncharacterized protein YbjT (DUF2867 family)
VEVAVGDVRDPSSLRAACEGVDTMISSVHGFAGPGHPSPRTVDDLGNANLIGAAEDGGAASYILISVLGAGREHDHTDLARAKRAAEARLRGGTLEWTIVRAAAFLETWTDIMASAPVLGRGDNPINFVSVVDVAAVVDQAVTDPQLRGRVLEVGGPDNLTLHELAHAARAAEGRTAPVRRIPRPVLRVMGAATTVLSPAFARKARAAIAMDTIDMAFDAAAGRSTVDRSWPAGKTSRTLREGESVAWNLKGSYVETCSCELMCPCNLSFDHGATYDFCRVTLVFNIQEGEVEGTDISGRKVALIADTPKVMTEGNWRLGVFIDDAASDEQFEKLVQVFSGQLGGPMAALTPLVGEMLGVERAAIEVLDDGLRHSVQVADAIDFEIEDIVPFGVETGQPIRFNGMFHPVGSDLTMAEARRSRINAFGIEYEGKTGLSKSEFSWAA